MSRCYLFFYKTPNSLESSIIINLKETYAQIQFKLSQLVLNRRHRVSVRLISLLIMIYMPCIVFLNVLSEQRFTYNTIRVALV